VHVPLHVASAVARIVKALGAELGASLIGVVVLAADDAHVRIGVIVDAVTPATRRHVHDVASDVEISASIDVAAVVVDRETFDRWSAPFRDRWIRA
jgi:hypothetical protein